ncbi:hypothetical protein VW23_026500 [Devosia insulae DS-56]|uniref:Uncharacterized protein n=1 Tax=Devosia insulae DS-56 TaxID=1116389 RepID=A0A1E5XKZ7_9HYPH|nr:hypothetical protein [Devosia insulae]OEO29245.1 hypothetical protein VW23_026500 [Devosia insulae DS-56]
MLKSVRVPHELIALSQMQRASIREVGAPLYLPAFEHQILEAEARREDDKADDLDWGVAAGGLTLGADEDDDFY